MMTNASECEIIANLRAMFFCYSTSFITSSASSVALPRFYFSSMPRLYHSLLIDLHTAPRQRLGLCPAINYIRLTRSPSAKSDPLPGLARTRSVAHYNRNEHNYRTTITATTWSTGKCSNYNPKYSGVVEVSVLHLEFHNPSLCPSLGGNCYLTPAGKRILLSLNRNKISI